MDNTVLLNNARWFAQIRWLTVLALAFVGISGSLFPLAIRSLGFSPPQFWPWTLAGTLVFANLTFFILDSQLTSDSPRRTIEAHIWLQIAVDLVVLTILTHIIGSTQTFIAFTYIFHITLACIFFSPGKSLLVTILAASMYLSCVTLEILNIWPPSCILMDAQAASIRSPSLAATMAVSAVLVWFVIWYLVSSLSEFVRLRDIQLDLLNKELVDADLKKNRLMLQTTHDLKAPFSGIENNIQILRLQHWNETSEPIRNIIERIEIRSETLRERIRDMLLLGELRSQVASAPSTGPVDLPAVIKSIVEELSDKAEERKLTVNVSMAPSVTVISNDKQLKILFLNLISNAILYSRAGGNVTITATRDGHSTTVSVADQGIGIKAEALPHIFVEYFRTKEASEFNKLSTGLGLAIVRQIAMTLGLKIRVESEENKGTTFSVTIPERNTTQAGG